MSKASRMFRSRSNREANLAIRPIAELDVPTFVEPDLSACLAALYNSSTGAFVDSVHAEMIPAAPFADQSDAAPESHTLLSFTPRPTGDNAAIDDVLAILFQTIDSAAPRENFSGSDVIAATFSDDSAIISTSSPDPRRAELFIVEKPSQPSAHRRNSSPKSWTWKRSPPQPADPPRPRQTTRRRSPTAKIPAPPKLSKNKSSRK